MSYWKNLIKTLSVLCLVLFSAAGAFAQYYSVGSDPAYLKWKQIKGEHFKVVYPDGTDSLARQYLYLFEKTRERNMSSAHMETEWMPIVLHPFNVNSNASVAWAPKRIDIYTTPEYNPLYAQNWDMQLALHEGRHAVQMPHYDKGFYRALYWLAGQQAIAIGVGLHPTRDILEGDAVMNETEFSLNGRGRSADFLMYYRAAFHEKDFRQETAWRFGSFNNFAPGKYEYGYVATAMARYRSGNYYTSGDIMQQQVWWWWRILDLTQWSYRYASGLTRKQSWLAAQKIMNEWWEEDYIARAPYNHLDTLVARRSENFFNYKNVLPSENGSALATKVGTRQANHLIRIDSEGKEHYLKPFSSLTSNIVSDGKGHYYFSEIVPDPRWELRSFSILRRYDEESNTFHNLTRRTRYFNPNISEDGKTLIAVENRPETGSDSYVVLLDAESADVRERIAAPKGWHIPEAVLCNGDIYALAIIDNGIGIYRYCDGEWKQITPSQPASMRDLASTKDGRLMFVSDLNGVSNLYCIDPSEPEPQLIQVGSSRFGITQPSFDKETDTFYYSDFDRRGYNAVRTPADSMFYKPASFDDRYVEPLADSLSRQVARFAPELTQEQDDAFREYADTVRSKRYNKLLHGINIHSWLPFYADINRIKALSFEEIDQLASLGATVVSQNELGSLSSIFGYGYRKGFHSGHVDISYTGLYPVLEAKFDFNNRYKTVSTITESGITTEDDILPINYAIDTIKSPSVDFTAKAYIPFNLSSGGWDIGIIPNVEYYISNDKLSIYGDKMTNRQSLLLNLRYYQMLSKPSARLTPRFGWGIDLNFSTMIGPHNRLGNMFYSNVYGYLPGFWDTHGLRLSWGWQKQYSAYPVAYCSNMISPVRGYTESVYSDFHKFSADYAIPVYGPFESVTTWLFYLQRMILIPFADVAINNSPVGIKDGHFIPLGDKLQYSFGSKLMFELHLFRFGFGFKAGVQYAHTGEGRNSFKFVFSTGL